MPAPAVSEAPKSPDIPPHLVKCVEKDATPPQKASADQLALWHKRRADTKKECGKAMLAWYRELQKAEEAKKAKKS